MEILVDAILETNGTGYLLYAANYPGAYVRGASAEEAAGKWPGELAIN